MAANSIQTTRSEAFLGQTTRPLAKISHTSYQPTLHYDCLRPIQPGTDTLASAAANSSANTNAVALIDTSGISDPVQLAIAEKVNELITAQRR